MVEGTTQEIEGLTGMIGQVLQERLGQAGMMKGMIREGKGRIIMIDKGLPGSKEQTLVTGGILHARE